MKWNIPHIVCLFLTLISWDSSFCQNKYTYWINSDYLKCLNNSLPCDCQKSSVAFNFIILGSKNAAVTSFRGIDKIELDNYTVSNYDKNKKQFNLENTQGIFQIEKDKMTQKRGKTTEKYVLFYSSDSLDEERLSKQNLKIINNWLVKKYGKSVFDFIPYASTCDCNYELGGVNLISIRGDARFWILENNSKINSYYLFEDTAKNYDKVVPYKFSKKLLFEFTNVFDGDAFLIGNHEEIVYNDSTGSKINAVIKNDEKAEKYYVFKLLKIYGNRIKVAAKYTIDAGHDGPEILTGWINYGSLGIYISQPGIKNPFAYSSYNKEAEKIFFDANLLSKPAKIKNIAFIDNQIWLQIAINNKTSIKYVWLSPEMQCVDIWNACATN